MILRLYLDEVVCFVDMESGIWFESCSGVSRDMMFKALEEFVNYFLFNAVYEGGWFRSGVVKVMIEVGGGYKIISLRLMDMMAGVEFAYYLIWTKDDRDGLIYFRVGSEEYERAIRFSRWVGEILAKGCV